MSSASTSPNVCNIKEIICFSMPLNITSGAFLGLIFYYAYHWLILSLRHICKKVLYTSKDKYKRAIVCLYHAIMYQ